MIEKKLHLLAIVEKRIIIIRNKDKKSYLTKTAFDDKSVPLCIGKHSRHHEHVYFFTFI